MLRNLTVLLFCMAPLQGQAQVGPFISGLDPRLDVNPISATEFEVIEARGAGAQDIWCAAARYAENTLGLRRGRIYVAEARGPAKTQPNRKGVVFTTEALPDPAPSVSVTVRRVGENLPIFHALQFCRNYGLEIEN